MQLIFHKIMQLAWTVSNSKRDISCVDCNNYLERLSFKQSKLISSMGLLL